MEQRRTVSGDHIRERITAEHCEPATMRARTR
jgi:hypothetical protein